MPKLARTILALAVIGGCGNHRARVATAPEVSAPLARIAIHYAPTPALTETWRQLFAVLPARVAVDVDVATPSEFAHFMAELREGDVPNRGRFRPVVSRAAPAVCTASLSTQLDEHTYAVGDTRSAIARSGQTPTDAADAERYDHAAEVLAARGFRVVRFPAVVRGATLINYTVALFDRERDGTRVVYLPTYALPTLDRAAQRLYESEGFVVRPIAATPGGINCLIDVLARG